MAYVERHPRQCPNGHRLGGADFDITVGWLPCTCNLQPNRSVGHRTVHCWKDGVAPL
jgi:hypothetical protein